MFERWSTLKRGEIAFTKKGDILLLIWKDKREVWIISTIHDASSYKTEKTNQNTGEEIKKPVSVVHYNNYMQGVDLADHIFQHRVSLEKQ